MRRTLILSAAVLAACAQVLGLNAGEPREDAGARADARKPDGATSEGDANAGEDANGGEIGVDAGQESGADTSPPPRVEPQITCGAQSCVPGMTKCELACGPQRMLTCIGWMQPTIGPCALALCDDSADCASAGICCGQGPNPLVPDMISVASCRTDCADAGQARLCDPGKPDCPTGTCRPWFGYYACL